MAAIEGFEAAPPAPPQAQQPEVPRLQCAEWCNVRDGHCDFEHVSEQCVCAGCDFCLDATRALGARLQQVCPATAPRKRPAYDGGASSCHIEPTMQPSAGVYNEEVIEGLDFAVQAIGERGMTAVLTLGNMWQWSGGFASYVWWATGEKPPRMTTHDQVDGLHPCLYG